MKKILTFVAIIFSIAGITILSGCNNSTNRVEIGDTIEITYTASLDDGTIFKSTEGKDTLRFIVGAEEVIPGLDKGVLGKKVNKTYTIDISPEEGYGSEYKPMNVQKISKIVFETSKIQAKIGERLTLGDLEGVVQSVETDKEGNEFVLLDVNPPYTYENLNYKFTIKTLEKAKIED